MKRYAVLPGLLLLTLASGCFYELRDEFAECKIGCSNRWAARAAWSNAQDACNGIGCPHSFKEGFMTGYIDVANGGTGCLPAVPIIGCHNHMWLDCCSENEKMDAWYDGYEHGAMAAKAEGMADSNRITTRIPQATRLDYSTSGQALAPVNSDEMSSGPAVPPAPINEAETYGGPQTRREKSRRFNDIFE